jgi:glycosyltransferase involved in cell wall biosynthesis
MVVHSYYPVGEVRAEREARAAVEEGYDVTVVCLRRPDEPKSETVDGIRIERLPVQHLRGVGGVGTIREYLSFSTRATFAVLRINRKTPVDVAYVHAPPDFLVVAGLIPRLLGRRVVIDIHDLSPHMFSARFADNRGARAIERLLYSVERAACAVASEVVTVHGPYRDELAAHGVPSDKITVVMNAPAPEPLAAARATARNGTPGGGFVVAYHGTITHWYGVDLIVEAIAQLTDRVPGIRGLVLGEGDALAEAAALAERLGVASRIRFPTALVSQADAVQSVAGASVGVIPNRPTQLNRFALSSKLLEYVSLGIPVVVSQLETLAAHFGPDEVTFFTPGDAASLAEAIGWVAEHPAEAREKASRAEKRASAYAWPTSRQRFLDALRPKPQVSRR